MLGWLFQNIELVVLVVTATGVFLGPLLAERVRQRHERQRENLLRLREHVLSHIRERLEKHYLPILRYEKPGVALIMDRVPKEDAPVEAWADESRQSLEVIGPSDEPHSPGGPYYYRRGELEADEPMFLWRDARRKFGRFFKLWDEFLKDFDEYHQTCLSEVNRLYGQVRSASQIPEHSLSIREPPWVNARWLAWYAFFRSLGLESARMPLELKESGQLYALELQNSVLAIGTREQMETYQNLANTFVGMPKSRFEEARNSLLDKASTLYEETQRLLLSVK